MSHKACLEEVEQSPSGLPKPVGDRGMPWGCTRRHSSIVWSYQESFGFYSWIFMMSTNANTPPQNDIPIRKWNPAATPELGVDLGDGKSCKIEQKLHHKS